MEYSADGEWVRSHESADSPFGNTVAWVEVERIDGTPVEDVTVDDRVHIWVDARLVGLRRPIRVIKDVLPHDVLMRVGVYVDGYNLYYGGRSLCGRGRPGWRWLNIRELSFALMKARWADAELHRLVYCTARVNQAESPSASRDQNVYIDALKATNNYDILELGRYVAWPKRDPLSLTDANGRPNVYVPDGTETWDSRLPITTVVDCNRTPMLMAEVRRREEMNRPGESGDSSAWEAWGHAGRFDEAVPAGVAGAGGADGR